MLRMNLLIIKWLNFGFGIFNIVLAILTCFLQHPNMKFFIAASLIHAIAFDVICHTIRRIDKKNLPPDLPGMDE